MIGVVMIAAAMSTPAQGPARIDRAVTAAISEVITAHPAIRCTRQASPPGFSCLQAGRDGNDHFAALSVTARFATQRRGTSAAVDSTLFGPGGASSRYVGQTSDHRFDVFVTEAASLNDDDPKLLPSAPTLIGRVLTFYRSQR